MEPGHFVLSAVFFGAVIRRSAGLGLVEQRCMRGTTGEAVRLDASD